MIEWKTYMPMNYDDDFLKFSSLLSHEKLKQAFEFSPLFVDVFEYSEYGDTGFWNGQLWYYNDPKIQEYFMSFCDGYTQGLVDFYLVDSNERDEAKRRMELQFHEQDDREDIVIDFSQYLK